MNLKKTFVFAIVLGLGIALGALLVGLANIALAQVDAEQFIIAFPPSPCNVEVYSRLVTAEDGTATASFIATPPSPCTLRSIDVFSSPDDSAICEETVHRTGRRLLRCEFSPEHVTTTFFFNAVTGE